jgi:hypothetical protein
LISPRRHEAHEERRGVITEGKAGDREREGLKVQIWFKYGSRVQGFKKKSGKAESGKRERNAEMRERKEENMRGRRVTFQLSAFCFPYSAFRIP